MKPIIAVVGPYNPVSGGERCRWHMLAALAQYVDVFIDDAAGPVPDGIMRLQPVSFTRLRKLATEGAVALYTDVTPGNPYKARHVMRWAMAQPGAVSNAAGTYWTPGQVPGEKVYLFHDMYRKHFPEKLAADLPLLYWPHVEHDLFNAVDLPPKRGDCLYLRKWRDPLPAWATLVPRMPLMDRPAFAAYLRRHGRMIVADYNTFAMWEAPLCATPSLLLPNSVFTRQEYEDCPLGLVGVAYGADPEEMARARAEATPDADGHTAVYYRYLSAQAEADRQLARFAQDSQEW